jgi:hypothetical protein
MSSRDTLALSALGWGYTVSRNISTGADTYERPTRTITVVFDTAGEVTSVVSSDEKHYEPTINGAASALQPDDPAKWG